MAQKYVYLFSEGNANMRELLGGKGANLAEMTHIVGVPPQTVLDCCQNDMPQPSIQNGSEDSRGE